MLLYNDNRYRDYIYQWDNKDKRFYKEIALVDGYDLKEIGKIFNNLGIREM